MINNTPTINIMLFFIIQLTVYLCDIPYLYLGDIVMYVNG